MTENVIVITGATEQPAGRGPPIFYPAWPAMMSVQIGRSAALCPARRAGGWPGSA
jgi:hypothetical protein